MRGDRGTRGVIHKVKKYLDGELYAGNPAGSIAPWGGGAAAAPQAGIAPILTLPRDENDDGDASGIDTKAAKRGSASLRRALFGTKALLRLQFKAIANHLAWLMQGAAGTLSFKALVLDGVGGASTVPLPGGSLQTSGDVEVGGNLTVNGHAAGNLETTGTLLSDTGRVKIIAIGPGQWQPDANFTPSAGALTASAGPATAHLEIVIPTTSDGKGAASVRDVTVFLNKTTNGLATVELVAYDLFAGTSAIIDSATTTTNGQAIVTMTPGTPWAVDSGKVLTVTLILPAPGDVLAGAVVEYTQNVF